MNRKLFAVSLLSLSIGITCASFARAAASLPRHSSYEKPTIVRKLSDLRSAYLLRAGYVEYDRSQSTPAGVRAQLRRHFNTVLGMLLVATPHSIETALDRLEASSGRRWSAGERAAWQRQLLRNRYLQMLRLAAYRDRGLFPLNEGQAVGAVPIFVDRHDTACAVGHLMRLSGWQDSVAAIQQSNNLVYVPDAAKSDVARWALTSGLTLEEAAIVQPGYAGFSAPYYINDYEPGELSLTQDGLKYENFVLEVQNFQVQNATFHQALDLCADADNCSYLIPGATVANDTAGFNAGGDTLFAINDSFNPEGTHWISLGGALYPPGPFMFDPDEYRLLNGQSGAGTLQRILLQFDVSTVDPDDFINQISQISYPTYNSFGPNPIGDTQYEMTTVAIDGGPIGSVHFEELPDLGFGEKVSSSGLPNSDQLTVATTIWLYNGAFVNSYVIGFQVVPEPHTVALSLCAVAGITLVNARRKSKLRG